jgi:pyridoxamine 5'-phosphate oxidase
MLDGGRAALCYHWKSLKRQVRVEGTVGRVDDRESDEYYASRPRGSRIGAWASLQSEVLDSRATLEARAAEIEKRFEWQDIPRPPHWRGFRVAPDYIEFWEQGAYRLHDRIAFRRKGGKWIIERLYP